MRVALVAGEASGDLLAAHLIAAIRQKQPSAQFFGIGGPKMLREGFDSWWSAESLAVHGYVEALRHYCSIAAIRRKLLKRLIEIRPDVFVGVDAPDFNLWLERKLRKRGIPVVHYVSPSVWAWRAGRVRKIGCAVDRILALFPFEPSIYERAGIPVTYVGHPLADLIPLTIDRLAARASLGMHGDAPVFALLPGSRQAEVRHLGDLLVETAKLLLVRFPQARFLVPLVSRETRHLFEGAIWRADASGLPIHLLFGHAQEALAACDVAIVASGTATLEAALMKAPMIVTYRMSNWSWRIMRWMRLQPWVGLPNILAAQFVAPEFLQGDATAENLAQATGNLMADQQAKRAMTQVFRNLHVQLRQGTAEKAASAVLAMAEAQ